MKNGKILVLVLLLVTLQSNAIAQLTGIKTIPGSYASIKLAVDDLNANGVGAGGVTFNITPGHVEIVPTGGLIIDITANQPTPGNPVVFQRSGAGINPVLQTDVSGSGTITGTTLGGVGDAILWLAGADYITFNNIDFVEQYTGSSQTLKTEYGILMVRKSSTDGCKHITYNGCTVQQQQSDIYSSCISTTNRNLAGVSTNPTTIDGRHESISIQGCTLNNSFNGMYFAGFADSSPYDLYDHFFDIGGTTGNILSNIGSGLAGTSNDARWGIYCLFLDSIIISNNTIRINNGSNNGSIIALYLSNGMNSSATVDNNDISDTCGTTLTGSLYALYCAFGADGVDNTINITNNTIHDCRFDGASNGGSYYIYVSFSPYTVNITGNTIRDNYHGDGSSTATGNQYSIFRSSTNSNFDASCTISNNVIKNIRRTQSTPGSGNSICIYSPGGAYNYEVSNNTIDSIYSTTSTTNMAGIYCSYSAPGMNSIHDNTVSNLMKVSGTTGSLFGIYNGNNTDTTSTYNNTVFNLYNNATTGATYGYNNSGSPTDGYENVYNNTIHDLHPNSRGFCTGISVISGSSASIKNVFGNNVYNIVNDSIGDAGGIVASGFTTGNVHSNRVHGISSAKNLDDMGTAFGMLVTGASGSTANVYNNMISEVYAPVNNSGLGVIGLFVVGDTSNISYNTIYIDSSSLGLNTGCYAVYLSGINAILKNNIIINKFTPSGSGSIVGIYKDSATVYSSVSNNNNVYVPTGASNYFYSNGSNTYSTFATFQTAVSPAETNSFAEDSPFMNVSTHPYNLDMKTNVPTLCDGGAMPIPGITTDIHGTTRNPSMPDVGADEFDIITSIEPSSLPMTYELYQNYPNPFNPATKIKFDIPKAGFVSLKVYDITGREVATLVNRDLEASRYEVEWNGSQFASGVYFLRINAGDFVKIQKMMLIK